MAAGDNPLITSLDMGDTSPEMMQQLHQGLRNSGPLFDQLWEGVKGLATLPSRVYSGQVDPMSDEAIQWGANLGMTGLGAGGATAAIAGRAPLNQVGAMVGAKAQGGVFDIPAAAEAVRMESAGVPRGQIWWDTNTYRDTAGNLRQEIMDPQQLNMSKNKLMAAIDQQRQAGTLSDPDYLKAVNQLRLAPPGTFAEPGQLHTPAYSFERAKGSPNAKSTGAFVQDPLTGETNVGFSAPMSAFQRNPLVYKAYPQLENMPVTYDPRYGLGAFYTNPSMNPAISRPSIVMGEQARDLGYGPQLLAHEAAGHGIADIEGWQQGTNPEYIFQQGKAALQREYENAQNQVNLMAEGPERDAARLQRDNYRRMLQAADQHAADIGYNLYTRTAGENDANMLMNRYNMSAAERRATGPWRSMPVPERRQIVTP